MARKGKEKKRKGTQIERNPSGPATLASLVASVFVVTPLAFLSPEMAMLGLGVTALAFFVLFDHRHRSFWELASENKFRVLTARQKNMSREIARVAHDIEDIKAGFYNDRHSATEAETKTETIVESEPQQEASPILLTDIAKPPPRF